ncbi:ATPase wrnip1, partial [Plakobranchus ocellatus]
MSTTVECPVCQVSFASSVISAHVNSCLNDHEENRERGHTKSKLKNRESDNWDFLTSTKPAKVFDRCKSRAHDVTKKRKLCDTSVAVKDAKSVDEEIIDCDRLSEPELHDDRKKTVHIQGKSGQAEQKNYSTNSFFTSCPKNKTKQSAKSNVPLAARMRPSDLEYFVGQSQAIKRSSLLHNVISVRETVPSMIFWGPPGCGKTTLAKIVGTKCKEHKKSKFVSMSAVSASVNDVKQVANLAINDMKMLRQHTILFLDEIHRFNKLQQDTLLPYVENGTLTLIGATTENPSFHVNSALLSRCRVVVFEKLSIEEINTILKRALCHLGVSIKTLECGINNDRVLKNDEPHFSQEENRIQPVTIEKEALDVLSSLTDGDARSALNGLQLAWEGCLAEAEGKEDHTVPANITVDIVKEALQRSHILYDKTGEEHFNTVSAMIKSLRGSDADAALYWMVRMLEGGENPLFVARRLVIFASEDIGLADPLALTQAVSTHQACHILGMPECALNLTHCVLYLAQAPKSACVVKSLNAVRSCIRQHEGPLPPVPLHLRNASTKLLADLGCGKGYKYPPDYDGAVDQEYLPPSLKGM